MFMKQKLLKRIFLAAVLLGVGVSDAWAFDVPDGYEIKYVFIGTDNGDGTVTAEDYESAESVDSRWTETTACGASHATRSIQTITNVPLSLGSSAYDSGTETYTKPTYVGGKTLALHGRGSMNAYFTMDAPVSKGYLVFAADGFSGVGSFSESTSDIYSYEFQDADGNTVLSFGFASGDGNQCFKVAGTNARDGDGNVIYSKTRTYYGYSIKEMVINMNTGDVSLTIDYVNSSDVRVQADVKTSAGGNFNIGTGKSIAKLKVSKPSRSQAECTAYLDNISFYSVGVEATHNYTVKATANSGATVLQTLASSTCKEDMAYSATAIPAVILNNGVYYVLDDANVSNHCISYIMGNADENQTVNYTADVSIAFFKEAESISNHANDGTGDRYSNGSYSRINNGKYGSLTTLGKGDYTISMPLVNVSGKKFKLKLFNYNNTESPVELVTIDDGSAAPTTGTVITKDFSLTENTALVLAGDSYYSQYFDYVIIHKTAGAYTIASDAATHLTFDNATSGTNAWENWLIDIYNNDSKVATVRADWWDDVAATNTLFTYGYTYSSDGGTTADNTNVWGTFVSDMGDADVDMTISYKDNTAYIIGTMTKGDKVYYVNYSKGGLTGDNISFDLRSNNATLSNITTAGASVLTTPAHPTNVAVTMGTNGYATYANNVYPLNLTSANAYKAAVVGSTVNFTLFEQAVPVSTGMLVKGSGTVNLPIADASSAVDGNAFLVNTGGTTFDAESGYTYFAMKKNSDPLTFATFAPGSVAIPATKAYLKVLTSALSGARLDLVFGDESTGIKVIDNGQMSIDNQVYNLQGQRVEKATKGLYIVDGKKVLVK